MVYKLYLTCLGIYVYIFGITYVSTYVRTRTCVQQYMYSSASEINKEGAERIYGAELLQLNSRGRN